MSLEKYKEMVLNYGKDKTVPHFASQKDAIKAVKNLAESNIGTAGAPLHHRILHLIYLVMSIIAHFTVLFGPAAFLMESGSVALGLILGAGLELAIGKYINSLIRTFTVHVYQEKIATIVGNLKRDICRKNNLDYDIEYVKGSGFVMKNIRPADSSIDKQQEVPIKTEEGSVETGEVSPKEVLSTSGEKESQEDEILVQIRRDFDYIKNQPLLNLLTETYKLNDLFSRYLDALKDEVHGLGTVDRESFIAELNDIEKDLFAKKLNFNTAQK